ncbi:MAG: hypothetical protein E6Q31_08370 [Aquabacterium sp.]|nr:MAG: hypothetical protein E6Q31_08370 [Aquabacterium sp.]
MHADASGMQRWSRLDARLLGVALVYLIVVAGLQAWASPTAELDQAEQLVFAQGLQWGYSNQPPLYTWLLWGLEQMTGPSLVVLYLVKVALLGSLAVSFVGIGHELQLSSRQRLVSLLGLAWLPAFVWEAQRDLTHSMMAATMASLMLWGSLWAVRRRVWWAYTWPGLAAAGALLSKHNAVIFVVSVLLTLLSLPDWRRRLSPGGVLWACVLMMVLCAPHGRWLLQHPDVVAQTTHKLIGAHDDAGWVAWGELLGGLIKGLLAFLVPWLLVAVPLWWRAHQRCAASVLLTRLLWVVMAVLLVFVLAIGAESFKGRWLFPLLFFVPLWLAASVDVAASRASLVMVGRSDLGPVVWRAAVGPHRLADRWRGPDAPESAFGGPGRAVAAGLGRGAARRARVASSRRRQLAVGLGWRSCDSDAEADLARGDARYADGCGHHPGLAQPRLCDLAARADGPRPGRGELAGRAGTGVAPA